MSGTSALVIPDSGAYQVVLVAHLVAVIVGFGGLILARRLTPPPTGVLEGRVEWFAYAVPVLGVILVMLSEDRWHFSEPWIGASFVAYVAALGIHQGVLRPARRRAAQRDALASSSSNHDRPAVVRTMGVIFDVLVIAAVALMVAKPGA